MNNMKQKKYHTVRVIPKSNIKFVERGIIDTPSTRIVIHESLEHSFNKSSDILYCDSKIFRKTYTGLEPSEQFKKLTKK
jgi:hypothetical protein